MEKGVKYLTFEGNVDSKPTYAKKQDEYDD